MKIVVACEFSQEVTEALIKCGHNVTSCDLLPAEKDYPHIQDDILKHLNDNWDMMIAFPPCTHLSVSGARWFKRKHKEQQEAIDFFMALINAPIASICIENPIGIMSTIYRKPDQIIHPWMFGHKETKATCLWLKNLPKLIPTNIIPKDERIQGAHTLFWYYPTPLDRMKERSRTFKGIAEAMALQWSNMQHYQPLLGLKI